MDIFTDKNTGFNFCIDTKDSDSKNIMENGIKEFNIIGWCIQFLSSEGTFIDVGVDMGIYSVILSKKCKEVHSFEEDKDTFNRFSIGLSMNNCFNVRSYNVSLGSNKHLDDYDISNVDLIRISSKYDTINVLEGASTLLVINNFPPIIFHVNDDDWYRGVESKIIPYIKELGYETIQNIAGHEDMFFASGHKLRKTISPITEIINKNGEEDSGETIETSYNLCELAQRYENGELNDNVTWDVWQALAMYYRKMPSSQKQSYDCVKRGLIASPPVDRIHMLYEEMSIVAYYVNEKDQGYYACEHVIMSPYTSESMKNCTLNNQSFYMKPFSFDGSYQIRHWLPGWMRKHSTLSLPPDYVELSSSIVSCDKGFKLCLSIIVPGEKEYMIFDGEKDLNENIRNLIVSMNEDLDIQDVIEITDHHKILPSSQEKIKNVQLAKDGGMVFQYMGRLYYGTYDKDGYLTHKVHIIIDRTKGFMPFNRNGAIHFVSGINPVCEYTLDPSSGKTTLIRKEVVSEKNMDIFYGSSNLVKYKDGLLGICRHVYDCGSPNKNKYFHRFVWFDEKFTNIKYSGVFYFKSQGMETVLSICHSKDGILVPFSADGDGVIGTVDYASIDAWLK